MDLDHYITLIQQELLGIIAPADANALQAWKKADTENETTYREIIAAWNYSNDYGEDISAPINLEDAFAAVQNKILEEENKSVTEVLTAKTKVKTLFHRWMYGTVAAAAIILLVLFVVLLNTNSNKEIVYVFTEKNTLQLSDGSTIIAEKGSQLKYLNNESFTGDTRSIDFEGIGYFAIVPNPQKPFIIQAPNLKVEVLGTTFFIDNPVDANKATVNLLEGKIKVSTKQNKEILNTGQSVTLDKTTNKMTKSVEINLNNYDWFQQQNLLFKEEKLIKIIAIISELYNVKIEVNSQLSNCIFTGALPNKDAEYMLELLKTVYGAKLEKQGNNYLLKGGECK